MLHCIAIARKLAQAFPASKSSINQSWLAKLIKKTEISRTLLSERQILKIDWNPKLALKPQNEGMLTTRIALLLSSGDAAKTESIINKLDTQDRLQLAGEASIMIRLAEQDAQTASINEDIDVCSMSLAVVTAAYYSILLLAGLRGSLDFPFGSRIFNGTLITSAQIPYTDEDPDGDASIVSHIFSRIEMFARISYTAALAGDFDALIDPAEFVSQDALSAASMPVSYVLSKLPIVKLPEFPPNFKQVDFFPGFFAQCIKGYMDLDYYFNTVTPETLPPAQEIVKEIRSNRAYSIWNGISEIQWEEGELRGLRLMPTPSGEFFTIIRIANPHEGLIFERFMEMPKLDDIAAWTRYEMDTNDSALAARSLSIPAEAIRMCVAPSEKKIRDGRVPSGFVNGPRKPSVKQGDVSVVYLPRLRIVTPDESTGITDKGAPTGITHKLHQVSGFLRQLPMDHKASATAKKSAAAFGIPLPDSGYTFVRPHARGKDAEGKKVYRIRKTGAK